MVKEGVSMSQLWCKSVTNLYFDDNSWYYHCFLLYFADSFLSYFYFGYSFTSVLFVIESPFPMHIFRIKEKWAELFIIPAIPSKGVSALIPSLSFIFLAARWTNMSCLILAHLRASLTGQSLIVLSYTTELLTTSLPVINEVYLLLSSVCGCLGSILL